MWSSFPVPVTAFPNVAVILLCLWALGARAARLAGWRRVELFPLLWPLLNLLRMTHVDSPSLVALENSVGLALFIVILLRRNDVADSLPLFRRWALPVFTVSYACCFLPLLVGGGAHPIYKDYGHFSRYVGWNNGPEPVSFSGVALGVWAAAILSDRTASRSAIGWALAAGVFACLGMDITILRIGIGTLAFAFAVFSIRAFLARLPIRAIVLVVLSAACVAGLFTTEARKKNSTPLNPTGSALGVIVPQPVVSPAKPAEPQGVPPVEPPEPQPRIQMSMNGNGRVELAQMLLDQSRGHRLFGLGTGSAVRYLRAIDYPIREPHNDYIRIFVDHGWVGVAIFGAVAAFVAIRLLGSPDSVFLFVFALAMLTDNVLVYPSFFYAPLFLGVLVTASRSSTAVVLDAHSPRS